MHLSISLSAAICLLGVAGSAMSQTAVFSGLGSFPGAAIESSAKAVSGNGHTIVGTARTASGVVRAVRWLNGGAPQLVDENLGIAPITMTEAVGVSFDGREIAGNVWESASCSSGFLFRLNEANPTVLQSRRCNSFVRGVGGGVVIGDLYAPVGWGMRWAPPGEVEALAPLTGADQASAISISADGALIVGVSLGRNGLFATAWIGGTAAMIPALPSTARFPISFGNVVSSNGAFAAGQSTSTANGNQLSPFIYRFADGRIEAVDLPPAGFTAVPTSISDDGGTMFGNWVNAASGAANQAFMWRRGMGMHPLHEVLAGEYGVNLTGWTLLNVSGASRDGNVVAGDGYNSGGGVEGWRVAFSQSQDPCVADFDNNGSVDGQDVEAFFLAWFEGEQCADVNNDGGTDGQDVEAFFVPWQAGGC